jgi:hypothetical protein
VQIAWALGNVDVGFQALDVDDLYAEHGSGPHKSAPKPGITATAKFDPRPIAEGKEPVRKRLSARKRGT